MEAWGCPSGVCCGSTNWGLPVTSFPPLGAGLHLLPPLLQPLAGAVEELTFPVGVGCKVQRKLCSAERKTGGDGDGSQSGRQVVTGMDGQEPNPSLGTERGRLEGFWQGSRWPLLPRVASCSVTWEVYTSRGFPVFLLYFLPSCSLSFLHHPESSQRTVDRHAWNSSPPLPHRAAPGMLLQLSETVFSSVKWVYSYLPQRLLD